MMGKKVSFLTLYGKKFGGMDSFGGSCLSSVAIQLHSDDTQAV